MFLQSQKVAINPKNPKKKKGMFTIHISILSLIKVFSKIIVYVHRM